MASRPQKISSQAWYYETLLSSDEESEELFSNTHELQTRAGIKRKRKQEQRKHKGLTKSPHLDPVLFERPRGEFRRGWSVKAIFRALIMKLMCIQLFCKEHSSEEGTFIEITNKQRDESAELSDHDDEFSTAIQNTRDHSSDPDMVNGVDVLQLPNPNYHQHNDQICDVIPIPQHENQDCAPSALVTSGKLYMDTHYKKEEVLQKPRFFVVEGFELLGKFINIIVTQVVRSGQAEFCVLKEVCEIPGEKQVTVLQEKAVNDPSLCPEAFDPHKTLEHIIVHLPKYSPFIGVDLKDTIEKVLKEIPNDWRAKDLNWDSAITSMTVAEDFMEQVTSGLESNGSPMANLNESLCECLEKMRMKINTVKYIKELSF